MRSFLTIFILFSLITVAQTPIEKCTDQLRMQIVNSQQNAEVLVWIIFNDKGPYVEELFSFLKVW